jgi:hypothetical protein
VNTRALAVVKGRTEILRAGGEVAVGYFVGKAIERKADYVRVEVDGIVYRLTWAKDRKRRTT